MPLIVKEIMRKEIIKNNIKEFITKLTCIIILAGSKTWCTKEPFAYQVVYHLGTV